MSGSLPTPVMKLKPLAESALLVELGDAIDAHLGRQVAALAAALEAATIPGVIDIVPAYTTILVAFDPAVTETDEVASVIERLAHDDLTHELGAARQVTIPTLYGGEGGPDLDAVASHTGLSAAEVIARHSDATYLVVCMGFAPGFGFLLGLPPELATPRLPEPRTRVPPGTVGIGGAQTGVYPVTTPGGWRLIGRTPLRMFDPRRPEPFLLRTGDAVHFRPIARKEYDEIAAAVDAGCEPSVTTSVSAR